MKVTKELTPDSQAILTIEAEPPEMEHSMDFAYRKLVQKVRVPGFRKGKMPRELFERYVGKQAVLEEAVEHLVPELYSQAVEREKIDPIADPHLEVTGVEPVSFKATVPLRPTVNLGDYRKVRVAMEEVQVTDEQIEKTMEQIRQRQAVWEPVDRAVEFGDVAVIDLQEEVEGNPPRGFQSQEYPVLKDANFPLPGFAEEVAGMNKGGEKEFWLSFPEDTKNQELAGKRARFRVKVLEVKEKNVPEWSDELAKSIRNDLDSVEALREQAKTDLHEMGVRDATRRFEDKVIDAIGEISEVNFPPVLVGHELDNMINQQISRFGSGEGARDMYFKIMGKTEEEVRRDLQPMATNMVKRNLILGKVSVEENIKIEATEIDAEIQEMAKGAGESATEFLQMFQSPQGRRVVEQTLVFKKTIERLTEIATSPSEGEESTSPEDETTSTKAEEESSDSQDNG